MSDAATVTYHVGQRLAYPEFYDFLSRSDLGRLYPREDFEARATRLLQNARVTVIARDADNTVIGVALGLTDFAYFLLVTDLGVARDWAGKGIGRELLDRIHDAAGGKDDIILYADSDVNAIGFYEKYGMQRMNKMMTLNKARFTPWVVGQENEPLGTS